MTAGGILAVGIISLLPGRLGAQAPGGVPRVATVVGGVPKVQFTNEKDALYWQLALARNERLEAKKAILDANFDLLSADAEVKSQPNAVEFRRKLERAENAFDIARQQEANWTNELARLETRLAKFAENKATLNTTGVPAVGTGGEAGRGSMGATSGSQAQVLGPAKEAEVDRVGNDLSHAKSQQAYWSKEVARLEARLKEFQEKQKESPR